MAVQNLFYFPNSGSGQLKYLKSMYAHANGRSAWTTLEIPLFFSLHKLIEDSTIHCIGCVDDMNAFSSAFTDFRVSEIKSLQC